MWNRTENDFGQVEEGDMLHTTFFYNGTKEIKLIEPKCNCTNFIMENNTLFVTWKIAVKHWSRRLSTYLTIVYIDDSITDLTLKADVRCTTKS